MSPRYNERPRRLSPVSHWPRYLAGIATEISFVMVLAAIALALAFLAQVIWQ